MANDQPPDMSSEYARLASFGGNTMDVAAVTLTLPSSNHTNGFIDLRYNSPMKMAKAGFYCVPGLNDNVVSCFACSAQWKNPQGESPMAIHRAMNPNCPHLKSATPSSSSTPFVIPRSDIENVRRCLFSHDNQDAPFTSENNNYLIHFQKDMNLMTNNMFSPIGGSDFLFESRRILTFDNLTRCSENLLRASEWAANGFIYREANIVQCVFCGLCLQFDTQSAKFCHEQKSSHCPFVTVSHIDIGNVTIEMENTINCLKKNQTVQLLSVEMQFAFVHPQYENIDHRLETFREWSPQMYQTSEVLCEAGFYYTGCADKVICFCCGVGLKKWRGQADPWTQHARLSPQCTFLKQIKGNDFVENAMLAEVQVDFDPPKTYQEGEVTSNGTVTTTSPVSAGLDLNVIKAALECQYTMPEIRQAILNIHNLTCGFPNFPLLFGELQNQDYCKNMIQQHRRLQQENERERQEKERERQEKQQLEIAMEMERQEKHHFEEAMEMERQEKERERQEKHHFEEAMEMERQEKERERQEKHHFEEAMEMERQEKERERQEKERERQEERERLRGQQLEQDQQQMYANVLRMAQERQTWQDRFRQEEERRRQEEERRRQEEERRRQDVADLSRQELELQRLRAEILRLKQEKECKSTQETADAPPPFPLNNLAPQCITCVEEPATALFLPCAHLCCGVQCAQQFLLKPCPVCRQQVQERKIVYVA